MLFSKADKRLVCYPPALENTEYTVPMGVKIIGDDAFESCDTLTSITLPESVTEIGMFAFRGCEGLNELVIPKSVRKIGIDALLRNQ